ncbi:SAP domain-containing protein [Nesterenkonia sp. PF2B19]|uniref:SAP domain-containing protein n=1 Tax=Nesterenkonia sp. PF2B19 TaxID=1881858 RepID=UPI000872875F|nr:SAP domain-containing protein [Nesterenkonia sp. PF2B19]OSM43466.1 hypothetical protein BCY76_008080 [Nesterenkonia sp. PF2B19]
MKIVMNNSVATRGGSLTKGRQVDVPDGVARSLVAAGHASVVDGQDVTLDVTTTEPIAEQTVQAEAEADGDAVSADEAAEEEPDEPSDAPADEIAEESAPESVDLDSLKVAELRELAAERDLSTAGTKAELRARLRGE